MKDGIANVEVLDLRSLSPLDADAIIATVKKTGKALVVHEDKVFGGFGGEVAALINNLAFEHLDGPVKRVGSTFTPVGFNRILEAAILPNIERIEKAATELLNY
jgi:2-oxoisovalerate dehydrogenase E1 component